MATHNNYLLSFMVYLSQICKQGTIEMAHVCTMMPKALQQDLKSGTRINLMVESDGRL